MPESRSPQLAVHVVETTESGGADLAFLRPKRHPVTHNLIAMSRLSLCLHNAQNLGLLRPSTPHNPHPAHVANLSFLRHQRPSQTNNPNTMSRLPLCPHKHQKKALVRHDPRTTNYEPRTKSFVRISRGLTISLAAPWWRSRFYSPRNTPANIKRKLTINLSEVRRRGLGSRPQTKDHERLSDSRRAKCPSRDRLNLPLRPPRPQGRSAPNLCVATSYELPATNYATTNDARRTPPSRVTI
jgi:hypothetical protein